MEGKSMKKLFFIWICLCLFIFGMNIAQAAELSNYRFFGVSADVTKATDGSHYRVKTKGIKDHEGFVFSPEDIKSGEKFTFDIQLLGSGDVFIKMEETDGRGAFIKETASEPIQLTKNWQSHTLNVELSPNTKQVDVMVLTRLKGEQQFSFKNVNITQ